MKHVIFSFSFLLIFTASVFAEEETLDKINRDTKVFDAKSARVVAEKKLEKLLSTPTPPPPPKKLIEIVSVLYSYKANTCDATGLFAISCHGKPECNIDVSNKICGKIERNSSIIKYKCGNNGDLITIEVPQDSNAILVCR